jgi:phosphatidylserine/phosphatidylglycerophosphate/cardiolipin synthase-like enzyme
MKLWQLTLLSIFITAPVWGGVKAYFNHNPKTSYTDPYRNISRPGDDLEQIVLGEIAKAKKTIFIAVQEIRLPLVAKALVEKKKQGVDVRVVIEHDYNFTVITQRDDDGNEHEASRLTDLRALVDVNKDGKFSKDELESRDAIHMLQVGKVPVMDDTFDSSNGSGLMHHKFMIVDGKSTIVSTANFTLSCIHGDILAPTSRGNANSMISIQATSVAKVFDEEFSQLWGNGKRGNFGHNKTYRGPQIVTVGGTKITIQFSPTSQRYNWEESGNGLIATHLAKAKKSIKAALFVYSDQKLSDVIENRHNAGVSLGFLVERKFAFREYSELLDMAGIEMLSPNCSLEPDNHPWKNPAKEFGIPTLALGDVLHHKYGVVDNKTVIVGSQNWSEAANYTNDETVLVIEEAKVADQFTQEYDRLISKSRLGVPATLKKEIIRLETECSSKGLYF